MPHLPPIRISGGSVKIRIPASEVKDKLYEDPLFNRQEPVTEPDAHSGKEFVFEQFSLVDKEAEIYSIEIRGAGEEVLEFRPKGGDCTVDIYFATSDELPVRSEGKWLGRDEIALTGD